MTIKKPFFASVLFLLSLALVACGGGGGGSSADDAENAGGNGGGMAGNGGGNGGDGNGGGNGGDGNGGGNGGNGGGPGQDPGPSDLEAPSGYQASFTTSPIDENNETAVAFEVTGAEIDAIFEYRLSLGDELLFGSDIVTQASFDITGLDVSQFPEGTILLEFELTDEAGNTGLTVSDTVQRTVPPDSVTLNGEVTFDFVPSNVPQFGRPSYDYDNIEVRPVRGATVEILDSSDEVIATTQTNGLGEYSAIVLAGQDVFVRVKAELIGVGAASWDFSVTDNTNGNAMYTMEGSLAAIDANQTRDLHAPADWNFPGYSPGRRAAPFAVLEAVYMIVDKFVETDPNIQLPPAEFRWSENNSTEQGDFALGQIGSSLYVPTGFGNSDGGNIYIVGAENDDTDEYDYHVIVHEWAHYFEDQLSRSDSIGGSHTLGIPLDLRLAFGEGWGNGLSGIVLDDPVYVDVGGQGQMTGFSFDVESDIFSPNGWYNEATVQSIIYDIYDSDPDGVDTVSLGLGPIYEALIAPDYVEQRTFTSIYSFLTQLIDDNPADAAGIRGLATDQSIFGTGFEGQGETNDNDNPDVLPVYNTVTVNGPAVRVCSDNSVFGTVTREFNSLGNRSFVQVDLPSPGAYTFRAERASGILDADPGIVVFGPFSLVDSQIEGFSCGPSESGNVEIMTCSGRASGEHVLDVFDEGNIDNLNSDNTGGIVCFDVTVTD